MADFSEITINTTAKKIEQMANMEINNETIDDTSDDNSLPTSKLVYDFVSNSASGVSGGFVSYSQSQDLTDEQKETARNNIDATGIYVGSGDMPDGYDVQIDPSGETLSVVDEITSSTSDELPNCKAVKNYVASAGGTSTTVTTESSLYGKKIVYDGDSICIGTYGGGGYAKLIADKVGGSYINQAVGGARLQTQEGSSGNFHSIVDNLTNLPIDGDLYCFEGGVNDVWSSVPLGTYSMSDYTGEVDKTTICGALETIFRYCLNNFIGKPICYIITHKVSSIGFDNYKNYHDSAVAICNKYSIPYYDAYNESGLNGWNTAQSSAFLTGNETAIPDGCHPNEDGYNRYYVPQLMSLFESIMPREQTNVEPDKKVTNILDDVGYEVGRLSTQNGSFKTDRTDRYTTGFIPINFGDVIYFKNIKMQFSDYGGHVAHYYEDKTFKTGSMFEITAFGNDYLTYNPDGTVKSIKWAYDEESVKFIRFCFESITDDSIITINEPIE